MALIKCPECGKEISDKANFCINCGCPSSYFVKEEHDSGDLVELNNEITEYGIISETEEKSAGLQTNEEYILCERCGTKNNNDNIFCDKCRKRLKPVYNFSKLVPPVYQETHEPSIPIVKKSRIASSPTGNICPKCLGYNIQYSMRTTSYSTSGKSEVREKSAITRAGNNIGRAAMIGMTGGLWALTPKKSKYKEVSHEEIKTKQIKYAVCQNCGYSWKL